MLDGHAAGVQNIKEGKVGKNIFLSYSWSDTKIADSIDSLFSESGITLFRDVRDLKYKQSISEFMKNVRKTDNVVMIISDNYLKSKNCMFEVLEFLKDESCKNRILPFISKGTNIFTSEGKLYYLEYWKNKYKELANQLKDQKTTECIPLWQELKQYESIKNEMMEFLSILSDMKSILYEDVIDAKMFQTVIDSLGIIHYETVSVVLEVGKKDEIIDWNQVNDFWETIPMVVSSFKVYFSNKCNCTYVLNINTEYTLEKLKTELLQNDIFSNLTIGDLFLYNESYYILSKRKTLEEKSHEALWWSSFSKGYTDNVTEAGIYSEEFIRAKIYHDKIICNDIIGIPKIKYDLLINLPVLPYDEGYYLEKLVDLRDEVIGDFNWSNESFFVKNV